MSHLVDVRERGIWMRSQSSDPSRKKHLTWGHSIAANLCIVAFALAGCSSSLNTVIRTMDQNKLARIAVEDKGVAVRLAAWEKLPAASIKPVTVFTNTVGMRFVYIKSGIFVMGSPLPWKANNQTGACYEILCSTMSVLFTRKPWIDDPL